MQEIWVEVNLNSIDAYSVLEWPNDIKYTADRKILYTETRRWQYVRSLCDILTQNIITVDQAYLFQVTKPSSFFMSRLRDQCYGKRCFPVTGMYHDSQCHVCIPTMLIGLGRGGANIEDYIWKKKHN